jgi:hypothetical protein
MSKILKIISVGQAGADRAALGWPLANGLPPGRCPPSGRSKDGAIPARYAFQEYRLPVFLPVIFSRLSARRTLVMVQARLGKSLVR